MPFRDRIRLPVVRHAARGPRAPIRPRGLGAAVPDLPRQGGHEPVPPRAAARRARRARARAGGGRRLERRRPRHDRRRRPRPRRRARPRPARRPRRSPTTGSCAAARSSTARSTTRPGTRSSTWSPAGSTGSGSGGRIDEPAAGIGFFSPLLAEQGELHASDEDGDALDLARDRLVAHRLRAHLHVADPWAVTEPDGPADAVVAAFLLGRVRGAGLDRGARLAPRAARRRRPAGLDRPAPRPAGRPAAAGSPGRGTTPR